MALNQAETARIEELIGQAPIFSVSEGAGARLRELIERLPEAFDDPSVMERLVALAVTSKALSRALIRHPHLLSETRPDDSVPLKVHHALFNSAALDISGQATLEEAMSSYSKAIDEIVDAELEAARRSLAPRHPVLETLPFAVVAMGKWGALELNYSSDIDLMFVHRAVPGSESQSHTAANALASRLIAVLSAQTFDGPALRVDADLRPEGTLGPLSRSLEAHSSYYERWAEPWELQALLKVRAAAGDEELGAAFTSIANATVWERGLDSDALRSIRRLKQKTEATASPRDIKRSPGGIRDIEFTVQILQLVHGRHLEDLRAPSTTKALITLANHGFVSEDEHKQLLESYRFLRNLEHRIQLWELRQTHDLPMRQSSLERLGRLMGFDHDTAGDLQRRVVQLKSGVRRLHEDLYFRPLLDALVGSPTARLGPIQASERLTALGFRDHHVAKKAVEDLTAGLSRRSQVMNQTMPLLLDWLSLSPNPDLGLGQLKLLLSHSRDYSGLIQLLQQNPGGGERLCLLLGTGKLLGDLMDRIPEFIPRLGAPGKIDDIRDREGATIRLDGLLSSRPDPEERVGTIRRFVRRRRLRIAARDVLESPPAATTMRSLSDTADVAVQAALQLATRDTDTRVGILAMGKWGGRELSYGSDLDVIYVHDDDAKTGAAQKTATETSRILAEPNRHGLAYVMDADLRPEGKAGPLTRSLTSTRRYYDEWAESWEYLALVRARPVSGDPNFKRTMRELVETILWRETFPQERLRDIRSIKARVEKERIPPGEDPDFHIKLGPGALSDVEFLTQLLQLQHGGDRSSLREPATVAALGALAEEELLTNSEHDVLVSSYQFCSWLRLRLHLQSGQDANSLPTDPELLRQLAVSLGFDRSSDLRDEYRRLTRRARRVFERRFFE